MLSSGIGIVAARMRQQCLCYQESYLIVRRLSQPPTVQPRAPSQPYNKPKKPTQPSQSSKSVGGNFGAEPALLRMCPVDSPATASPTNIPSAKSITVMNASTAAGSALVGGRRGAVGSGIGSGASATGSGAAAAASFARISADM